jgi:photosystem II stability/assembly factor-like uncharacterized protein
MDNFIKPLKKSKSQLMKFCVVLLSSLVLFLVPMVSFCQQPASPLEASFLQYQQLKKSSTFGLQWQSLGPVVNSARVEAVQSDPTHPGTMYISFGSGNLWKTTDNGLTWKAIFEDEPVYGIGDIALAPSNPNILYVGTGVNLKKPRNFTMPGNGVYKSEDGGNSWKYCGLNDSWQIGKIAVDPTNPDIVVVAVLGHFWSTNKNRGIYRTIDGGKTWEHALYIDEKTGANDIVISHSNPNIMYASMWEMYPGITGKNSGIYVSRNGGKSWEKSSNGFPQNSDVGRIGVAVSYTNPLKAYALVDNEGKKATAEIYKTQDGGKNWEQANQQDLKINSVVGWYFEHIYVNPKNDDEIFGLGVRMAHSTNGGKDFTLIGGDVYHLFPSGADRLHLDQCELWINPENPDHMALGNDGGLYVTYNKGLTWLHHNNIPAGEFYDITVDNQNPYNIYGGTQDDATVYGPAKEWNPKYADQWKYLWVDAWSGGDGCITQVDPADPNTVYFSSQEGAVMRKNMKEDRSVSVKPKLPENSKDTLQYNFVTPYIISHFDSKTLYHAGNYVFKSTNRGDNWKLISDDLSHSSDPKKNSLAAGAFAESPIQPGHLFLGTDKGAFWCTDDDGATWKERSKGLPNGYIRSIFPSRFQKGRIYVTLTGLNYDDLSCHIYVSENGGEKWQKLQGNLPDETSYVIYEDPQFENLLFAGLYRGVYISVDRGITWSLFGDGMPARAVSDLEIEKNSKDLIAATYGRGIYKTNLKPLYEALTLGLPMKKNYLFEIPTVNLPWVNDTHRDFDYATAQKVSITFWSVKNQAVALKIVDEKGNLIWSDSLEAKLGVNEFRRDLITKHNTSPEPYFINYDEFIEKGKYKVIMEMGGDTLEGKLQVEDGIKPLNK